MSERTVRLDADPRDWRSRKIRIRAHRWYARVELDRDGYVDTMSSKGRPAELPAAYNDAVEEVQGAAIDRLWYDGSPGDFILSSGNRWITLPVPYTEVEAAVEALRRAELDHDYRALAALAGRLTLPVDDWLAPGERELLRGVDFHSPPAVFLRFLRGKARRSGLRLNGRATAGSVWVRPTLQGVLSCPGRDDRVPAPDVLAADPQSAPVAGFYVLLLNGMDLDPGATVRIEHPGQIAGDVMAAQ